MLSIIIYLKRQIFVHLFWHVRPSITWPKLPKSFFLLQQATCQKSVVNYKWEKFWVNFTYVLYLLSIRCFFILHYALLNLQNVEIFKLQFNTFFVCLVLFFVWCVVKWVLNKCFLLPLFFPTLIVLVVLKMGSSYYVYILSFQNLNLGSLLYIYIYI